jgi:hypothetical protein
MKKLQKCLKNLIVKLQEKIKIEQWPKFIDNILDRIHLVLIKYLLVF